MFTERDSVIFFDGFSKLNILAAFTLKPRNLNFRTRSETEFKNSLSEFAVSAGFSDRDASFFNQVHGTDSILIDRELMGCGARRPSAELIPADAGFTNLEKAPLVIFTADCIPLFVSDAKGSVAGLLHVGWRGAETGIISKVLLRISNEYNLKPTDLIIGIGPAIRSCCYEVGAEFETKFGDYVIHRDGKHYLDLAGYAKNTLNRLGVQAEHIWDTKFCTACDPRFHSYRREGEKAGRIASVIMKLST